MYFYMFWFSHRVYRTGKIKYICLLSVGRPWQVGRFFGEVDGSVMASLIKSGMYKKYVRLHIAACSE